MSDWLRACLVAAVGLAMAGCGGGYQAKEGVIVKGTVLKGAQPLRVG